MSLNCRDELGWFLSVVAFSMISHALLKKCEMDWESLYCPNRRCRYDGRLCLQRQLVSHKLSAGHAKRMSGSEMGPSTGTCTQTQPCLRWRCGHEQKAMRSARRHASSKSTKMPWAAQHCRLVMFSLWRDLPLITCLRKPITAVEGHGSVLQVAMAA